MIKIRYSDELCPGLNASAERGRRGTTIYLLPGLTNAQRRAALRRLRQQGRMELGPALPPRELALALAALRMRNAAARAGAIFRVHPAGSTVPLLVLSAVVAVFVMASVSVRIVATPQAAGQGPGYGLPSPSPASGGLGSQLGHSVVVGSLPGQMATTPANQRSAPAAWPGSPGSTPASGTGGSPLSSIAATSPPPAPATSSPATAAAPSTQAPPPTLSAVPNPTQTPDGHGPSVGNCVTIGFLQVCLSL